MKKSYIYIVFLIFLFIVIVPNSTLVPQSTTTAAENLVIEMRHSVPKSKDRMGDHVCTWKRSEQFRPEGICYSLLCLGEEGVVVGW